MGKEFLEDESVKKKLEQIDDVIVVLSGKGGVGKSTVAANFALSLALQGFKVGILDVDIHGPSIPKLLGLVGKRMIIKDDMLLPLDGYAGIKVVSIGLMLEHDERPVIWRGPMKANMIRELLQHAEWGKLDYLIVDSPPGTGDEPLSIAQFIAKKARAVILTTPQEVSTIDVEKCITFCKQLSLPITGIIENMSGFFCSHCGKETAIFSHGGGKRLAEKYSIPFLGTIPIEPTIVQSGDRGRPFVYFYEKTEAAKRFDAIAAFIVEANSQKRKKQSLKQNTKRGNKRGTYEVCDPHL